MRGPAAVNTAEVYISRPQQRIEGHLASSSEPRTPRRARFPSPVIFTDRRLLPGRAEPLPSRLRHPKVHTANAQDQEPLLLISDRPQPPHKTTAKMLGLSAMQPRQLAAQVLNFALVLSTAFMLWKGLSIASDSPSPIVVVLSGSMEPAFQRGDLLFLWNRGMDTQVGEIVVYNVKGKDIPIVHRVVRRYGGG